jgi:hypothetical protein
MSNGSFNTPRKWNGSNRSSTPATYPSSTYTPRRAVAKSRNKAVKRVYRRYNTVPKGRVATNKLAIATLARQVKSLQLSRMGEFQKQYEYVQITGGDTPWSTDNPLIFAANNFLHSSHVWIGKADTVSFPGHTVPGYIPRAQWAKRLPQNMGARYADYDYWGHANDDVCSSDSYKAISTTIDFNFEAPSLGPNQVYWVRIDVIKPKRIFLNSNSKKLSLPANVQSLGNLANDDMTKRNRINRDYFTIIKTKWVKLENLNNEDKTQERWHNYYLKFPDRSNTQKLDVHTSVSTETGQVNETFVSNMPQDQIYWVLLSTSAANNCAVEMTRVTRYRDTLGVAG